MGISMKITPVSFCSKNQKVKNMQDFETLREQALDRQLKEMLPMFVNGEADVVFISTTVNPNQEIEMDIKVAQMESLELERSKDKPKETFWTKLKKIFNK